MLQLVESFVCYRGIDLIGSCLLCICRVYFIVIFQDIY